MSEKSKHQLLSLKVKLAVPVIVSLLACLAALAFALKSNSKQISQIEDARSAIGLVKATQPLLNAVVLELNQHIYPVKNFKSRLKDREKSFTKVFQSAPHKFNLRDQAVTLLDDADKAISQTKPTSKPADVQKFLTQMDNFYWSIIDQSGLVLAPNLDASYLLSTGTQGMPDMMQDVRNGLLQLGFALVGQTDKQKALSALAIMKNSADRLDRMFARRALRDPSQAENIKASQAKLHKIVQDLEPRILKMTDNLELGFEYVADSSAILNVAANQALDSLEKLANDDLDGTNQALAGKEADLLHKRNILLIGAGLAIILVMGATASIVRSVLKSVRRIQEDAKHFAEGDLTHVISCKGNDEITDISLGLAKAQGAMKDSLGAIRSSINTTESNSKNLIQISSQITSVSKEQTSASQSLSETFQQLSSALGSVFEQLDSLKSLADEGEAKSGQGKQIADSVNQNSELLTQKAKTYETVMQNLAEEAKAIQAVTSVIDELAERTNLLALNASIEAARAGEQGRGFAVVADEVRGLADQTGNATQRIRTRLETLADNTSQALSQLSEWMNIVGESRNQSTQVISHIGELGHFASHACNSIQQIVYMLQGPEQGSKAIGRVIEQLNALIEQGQESAKNLLKCAGHLQQGAREAGQAMQRFKIE